MTDTNQILADLAKDFPNIGYVAPIKSGKEAQVHLVATPHQSFALKVYKQDIKFSSRREYFNLREVLDSREGRAVKNKSRFGKQIMLSMWAQREYEALVDLGSLGAAVPEVYSVGGDYLLLEFIGAGFQPAPQLHTQRLSPPEAETCFEQIADNIELFWNAGYVHGDLSAYNILWHEGRAVIIDLPQVVKISQTADAPQKLLRDIENVESYFAKYNLTEAIGRLQKLKQITMSW